ncbi:glycerol-3-phosphate 1-O-acyltransferase PlsY [Paenibacillus sp. IB182496]|uniref:Glycerol-3-phosphate acyltransferase n=1 Tax=Paenibacillus sabuli TaxID=2772509 RepID=A0A927BSM4_9BACL|nr:glycerol-3-phosphate 1-O-acyltransferase PlsY [Paenibacillus sabuli]MBD2845181.1 glycerol-3-phosphate 1-O-acyltransferase PlsY [Paenibacillus sabuli]
MLVDVILIGVSYLLGSLSFSILIAKWVKGIDIRDHGSGNAGATNTLRVLGKGPAIVVLVLDAAKGVAAVLLAGWLADGEQWTMAACGLAAIAGHNWPVWFRFKGGKGIATTVGALAALAFFPALYAGLLAIAVIALTRYVSLGSLVFAAAAPLLIFVMRLPVPFLAAALVLCLLAFIRHRTNIAKLLSGQENRLGGKKGVTHGKS